MYIYTVVTFVLVFYLDEVLVFVLGHEPCSMKDLWNVNKLYYFIHHEKGIRSTVILGFQNS